MVGLLSQTDPRQYPKLEDLLRDERKQASAPTTDPAEASQNARAWGLVLQSMNRKARRSPAKEE